MPPLRNKLIRLANAMPKGADKTALVEMLRKTARLKWRKGPSGVLTATGPDWEFQIVPNHRGSEPFTLAQYSVDPDTMETDLAASEVAGKKGDAEELMKLAERWVARHG